MKKNGKNYLCYISVTSFLSENQFYKTNEYLCLFCIKRKYARKTQLSIQYPHRSFNVRPLTNMGSSETDASLKRLPKSIGLECFSDSTPNIGKSSNYFELKVIWALCVLS